MAYSTINTSVSGNTVTISVNISPSDGVSYWGIYVYAHTDHGLGSGGSDPNYTYFVERINGAGTGTYFYDRTYSPDLYIAELALQGMGTVDYKLFSTLPSCTGTNSITFSQDTNNVMFNVCVDTCGGYFYIGTPSGGTMNRQNLQAGICQNITIPKSLFTVSGHYIAYLNGLDNSPLFQSGFDVTIPSTTYQCINNICKQQTCTVGTANCYTTNTCNNICAAQTTHKECVNGICTQINTSGIDTCSTLGASCCVPKADEMNFFGTCIKKNYVYMGIGFVALMMMMK